MHNAPPYGRRGDQGHYNVPGGDTIIHQLRHAQWLKWFCEAGGGAHLTNSGWSKPHTHSNPTNLALFRHKITLYRFNQGGEYHYHGRYTMVNHGIAVVPHRCTTVYHSTTTIGTMVETGTILSYHGVPWYTNCTASVPWYTTT